MELTKNGAATIEKISRPVVNDKAIAELNAKFANHSTKGLLDFVLNSDNLGDIAAVSSFGAESAILLHLISTRAPATPILFLDTGKQFSETLAYQEELTKILGLQNMRILRPDAVAIKNDDPQGSLWLKNHAACCDLRKVIPLHNALNRYDGWISGRKSHQNDIRSPLKLFERSGKHVKINPLANWSRKQLANYMETHKLSTHPLVSQGYASIGCAPCTTPVREGEDPRAGRWRNIDKTECGIHFVNGNIVRGQQQSL